MKEMYILQKSMPAETKELEERCLSDLETVLKSRHYSEGYARSACGGMSLDYLKLSPIKGEDKGEKYVSYFFPLTKFLESHGIETFGIDLDDLYKTVKEKISQEIKQDWFKEYWGAIYRITATDVYSDFSIITNIAPDWIKEQ